jgi:hypothetical protein
LITYVGWSLDADVAADHQPAQSQTVEIPETLAAVSQ